MAAEDVILTLLTISFMVLIPFIILVVVLGRRFMKRNHVWLEIKTPKETLVKLVKPNKDGRSATYDGVRYYFHPDALDLYKGGWLIKDYKPRYRYKLGEPFPYRYGTKKVIVETPETKTIIDVPGGSPHEIVLPAKKQVQYERFDEPKVIPGKTMEVFMKSKTWSEIYQRHDTLTFFLVVGVILLVILVIGLYSVGGH